MTFYPSLLRQQGTGGFGKSEHGFCKELKSRRERLNCCGYREGGKIYTAADPRLVAITVELQRANSRIIPKRTPQPENLIASEIVKREHSVAIKRDKAIERLCLEYLKSKRITVWKFLGPTC